MNITKVIRDEITDNSGIAVQADDFSVSYAELFTDLDLTARQLSGLGIGADDKVALLGNDSYQYIVFSLAILELNAAVIPVPANSSKPEIEAVLEQIKVNHLIFSPPYYSCENAVEITNTGYFLFSLPHGKAKPVLAEPLRAAFIRFSSGTTGGSKGVILSHRALIERTAAVNKVFKIDSHDRILWVLDMSFHFVVTILLFLRKRATIVICGSPLPEKMSKAMAENEITVIYATPYHYRLMLRFEAFTAEMLLHLRLAISTAMKLDPAVAEMFREKFGFNLTQAYGIIEVGLPFINTSPLPEKSDSVGAVLPDYQLKLENRDEQGRGEIMLKGPGMFDAYFEPFRLAENILNDGWFDTGDIGRLDEDGYLFIVGRSKNIINFIGMKIFPYEVEKALLTHPAVREVKVQGRAHDNFGEIPVAYVVLQEKYSNQHEQIALELRKFCIQRLAAYCVPKEFIFVPELAKTKSGKIVRKND